MPIDEQLLELLACPLCSSRPKLELKGEELVCPECHSRFPIRDNIPYLRPEDAIRESDKPNHE